MLGEGTEFEERSIDLCLAALCRSESIDKFLDLAIDVTIPREKTSHIASIVLQRLTLETHVLDQIIDKLDA